MSTRNIVKNIRSAEVIQGKPKLPTSDQLGAGEIAVNYAKGYETLSFKNNSNEIVSLSVKTVDDVKVNGNSVVSNKTANITMKGNTTPVANTYSTTTFPSPFESKAEHISATDKVDAALKKVETNISNLVSDVVNNENVVSEAINKLANSAGTIDGSNNITYVKATNAHYIKNATSVHDATVKLDSNVFTIKGVVDTLRGEVDTIKGRLNTLESTVIKLQGQISSIPTMEFVDLDLPKGTLWAKCNLGAVTETDYGDYYMWGSTTPDNNHACNWTNAPFNNGSSSFDGEYFDLEKETVCPNGVLAKEFDAAYKATNGMGRMPTVDDFNELLSGTTNEWVTNYKGTGVRGRKFTSKADTSKYIFIPAAGTRSVSSFMGRRSSSNVWSSSLNTSTSGDNAWHLSFSSSICDTDTFYRYNGCVVRAVRDL